MTIQETTTLTATFTQTETLSSGYTTMTVLGCSPAGFPYSYCPEPESGYVKGGDEVVDEVPAEKTIEDAVPEVHSMRAAEWTGPANEHKLVESRIYKIKLI